MDPGKLPRPAMKRSRSSSPSLPCQRLRSASSELHRSELRVQPKPVALSASAAAATACHQEPARHGEDVVDGGGAAAAAASAPSGGANVAAATSQGSGIPAKGRASGDATMGTAAHGHIAEPALQSLNAKPTQPNKKPPEGTGGRIHPVSPYSAAGAVKAIKKPTPPSNPPPEGNKGKIHPVDPYYAGGSGAAARTGGEEIMADQLTIV